MFLATIPAVLYVDRFGRKVILITGGIGMAISHFVVAGIVGAYSDSWESHRAAGWVAVVFVWFYAINFGYSWGPVAWVIISEVYPLGMRAKGVSLGGSSNWLNNVSVSLAVHLCRHANSGSPVRGRGLDLTLYRSQPIRRFRESHPSWYTLCSTDTTSRFSSAQSLPWASSGYISSYVPQSPKSA